MTEISTNKRSETMRTPASTTASISSIKSRRVLVYDMAEARATEMSKSKFENLYSGKETTKDRGSELICGKGILADYISFIPIPKGASDMDISPDDLCTRSTEEIPRSRSPEHMEGSGFLPEMKSKPYSRSYTANVHIPAAVFYTRMIVPRLYPDLIVISRPSLNSQKSSRSNTADSHPLHD